MAIQLADVLKSYDELVLNVESHFFASLRSFTVIKIFLFVSLVLTSKNGLLFQLGEVLVMILRMDLNCLIMLD